MCRWGSFYFVGHPPSGTPTTTHQGLVGGPGDLLRGVGLFSEGLPSVLVSPLGRTRFYFWKGRVEDPSELRGERVRSR